MCLIYGFLFCISAVSAQTLGLGNGFLTRNTTVFDIALVKDSQTLYSLKPRSTSGFDFIPSDKMTLRQGNHNYHLGDITFRARTSGSSAWISGDTSTNRRPVTALSASGAVFAASDLTPTLPTDSPLNIVRRWVIDNNNLQLSFTIKNAQSVLVEIGALGVPLEFNNVSKSCATDQTA